MTQIEKYLKMSVDVLTENEAKHVLNSQTPSRRLAHIIQDHPIFNKWMNSAFTVHKGDAGRIVEEVVASAIYINLLHLIEEDSEYLNTIIHKTI